jgi:hypothetical protein
MSTLSITRSLVSFTNPTETQFDTIRTGLLNFFNTTSLDDTNISSGGMVYTKLTKALDNATLKWTSSHMTVGYVSATPTFKFTNSQGDLVFRNTISSSEAESLRFADSGTTTIGSGGLLKIGQGVGSQVVDTAWLLAKYRKPRLEYVSADVIQVGNNTGTADESVIIMRDRLCKFVDNTMSLAVTANGYESDDTGAAVSGLEIGLTRTANRWYYIYAVQVQYGDDNDGTKAILVASETSPLQANAATLDTEYGSGKWVYMGLIRNGYNDGVNTDIIIPFQYDGYGQLWFTTTSETGKGQGLRLATATGSSADLTYTIAFGNGQAQIPATCTRAVFVAYRSGYSGKMAYESGVTGEYNLIQSAYDDEGETSDHNTSSNEYCMNMEVPLVSGHIVRIEVGTDSTNQRIMLASVVDHYV